MVSVYVKVANLQAQLLQARAQLVSQNLVKDEKSKLDQPWTSGYYNVIGSSNPSSMLPNYYTTDYIKSSSDNISPQSSTDSVDHSIEASGMQKIQSRDHLHHPRESCNSFQWQQFSKKRPPNCDLGELQALALRMMRNWCVIVCWFELLYIWPTSGGLVT